MRQVFLRAPARAIAARAEAVPSLVATPIAYACYPPALRGWARGPAPARSRSGRWHGRRGRCARSSPAPRARESPGNQMRTMSIVLPAASAPPERKRPVSGSKPTGDQHGLGECRRRRPRGRGRARGRRPTSSPRNRGACRPCRRELRACVLRAREPCSWSRRAAGAAAMLLHPLLTPSRHSASVSPRRIWLFRTDRPLICRVSAAKLRIIAGRGRHDQVGAFDFAPRPALAAARRRRHRLPISHAITAFRRTPSSSNGARRSPSTSSPTAASLYLWFTGRGSAYIPGHTDSELIGNTAWWEGYTLRNYMTNLECAVRIYTHPDGTISAILLKDSNKAWHENLRCREVFGPPLPWTR